jgi:hypothetical protein
MQKSLEAFLDQFDVPQAGKFSTPSLSLPGAIQPAFRLHDPCHSPVIIPHPFTRANLTVFVAHRGQQRSR